MTVIEFQARARRYLFRKVTEEHQYKIADAMAREVLTMAPMWRGRYLAARAYYMPLDGTADAAAFTGAVAALKKAGLRT